MRKTLALLSMIAVSTFSTNTASGFGHHRHAYYATPAIGFASYARPYAWTNSYYYSSYSSFYPNNFGLSLTWSRPFYSTYRPFYRSLGHHYRYRPYYTSYGYYNSLNYAVLPYTYSYHTYLPTWNTYSTYSVPIVRYPTSPCVYPTTSFYSQPNCCEPQPIYNDCCSYVPASTNYSGYVPTVIEDSASPSQASPPIHLEIRNQQPYQIDDQASWLDVAVDLIDDMVDQGALQEAEDACTQLLKVRKALPSEVVLRAGLLGLANGKSENEVASLFRLASHDGAVSIDATMLSARFTQRLASEHQVLETAIQNASKAILTRSNSPEPNAKFVSAARTGQTQPTILPNSIREISATDAEVILDTLLRVSGETEKANAISEALEHTAL